MAPIHSRLVTNRNCVSSLIAPVPVLTVADLSIRGVHGNTPPPARLMHVRATQRTSSCPLGNRACHDIYSCKRREKKQMLMWDLGLFLNLTSCTCCGKHGCPYQVTIHSTFFSRPRKIYSSDKQRNYKYFHFLHSVSCFAACIQ